MKRKGMTKKYDNDIRFLCAIGYESLMFKEEKNEPGFLFLQKYLHKNFTFCQQ